jgi:hypothetical protein
MADITITIPQQHVQLCLAAKEAYNPGISNEQFLLQLLRDEVIRFRRNQLHDETQDAIDEELEEMEGDFVR